VDRDFLREPFGHGWHLNRPAFNMTLLEEVAAAGIPVWRETRVEALERNRTGWTIEVDLREGARTIAAEWLIDASGRGAVVARHLGIRRRRFDSQVAVAAQLEQAASITPLHDATTLIEATETGWWYAALLPDGRLAVTFFTDSDLLARSGAWRPASWWRLLRASDLVWGLIYRNGYGMPGRIQTVPAGSWLLAELTGERWIAAGDAAASFDPLSSHGIGSALAGGQQAAAALAATIQGDATALSAYTTRIRTGYAKYLWLRHAYYADERRWPDATYWIRRHGETGESLESVDLKSA
jgi:flavin-dependent dehydrogenase